MKPLFTGLLLGLTALAQAQDKYTVTGTIGDYNAPAFVILNYREGDKNILDTATFTNGAFTFTGVLQKSTRASLHVSPTGKGKFTPPHVIRFWLEKGKTTVKSKEFVAQAMISGKVNQPYLAYLQSKDKVAAFQTFLKQAPASPLLFTVVNDYTSRRNNVAFLDSVYASLPKAAQQSEEGKEMAARIYGLKNTSIGSNAPNFTQADTSGRAVSLTDFRGKYVLLDFWASWCGPCRAENPNVIKAYEAYKNKNFAIVAVSLDGVKDKWTEAIQKDGLPWTHVSDLQGWGNAVAKMYNIHGVPSNFLLDPDGKIIARNLRGEALQRKLAALLQ